MKRLKYIVIALLTFISYSLSAQCDYYLTVTVSTSGYHTGVGYVQEYVFVDDASGIIMEVNTTGTFTPTNSGLYRIYAVNYLAPAPAALSVGSLWTGVETYAASNCMDILGPYTGAAVSICEEICELDDIVVSTSGYHTGGSFQQTYVLVNDSGTILETNTSGTFSGYPVGVYLVYAVNTEETDVLNEMSDLGAWSDIPAMNATYCMDYIGPLAFEIVSSITPLFDPVGPYCEGDAIPALSTTSLNGISGSWAPAINNTATTLYTFTPDAGQCAIPTDLTITIDPQVTPTFAAVGPYCEGDVIPALTTTSNEGITGTWAPAIDNTTTTVYTFTPDAGQCATTQTLTITIDPQVTPTFAAVGPYCEGDVIPALTTTSNEGITGSWAPAIDNTTTTVYTFTPDAGQCATTQTLTITIDPQVTPTFAAVGPYCEGDVIPALTTTSNEGITGSWAPAIDNTTTTVYTFTPDAGQCATTQTLTITIDPQVTPTFAAVGPYCEGDVIPALTTTSNEGITGSWAPAIDNTTTTVYTFTPDAGQCATTQTLTITIDPQVTPTFAAVGPYCEGDVIPALTTTSNEGITGTWAPAIDNTTTTVYTFTPDAGQCATTQTLTITIDPQVTPTFAAVGPYCEGDVIPALTTTSNEGITGSWAPAIDNTTTTVYAFTPDAGQCATTQTLTITIDPQVTPTFAAVGPYCEGDVIPALTTTSNEGITGSWAPAIDNTTTTVYTFTPDAGQCATTQTLTITIDPQVTPTFAAVGPYCEGDVIPALTTTSNEGITGSWAPAIDNTTTTVYTFTPDAGQCATTQTLTITISPEITPIFDPVGPYCEGDAIPALPTTSNNGVTGTWAPAIDNTTTTVYMFTPDPGQCAKSESLTITIIPEVTPTFNPVGPYCEGDVIPALPLSSNEGITGSWAPVIDNTTTTVYTFTPDAGQCATTQTLTITIDPQVTPTFAAVGPYCEGDVIPALTTTSNEGIIGSWAPAIDNTTTTVYTFTPDAGQCATTQTLTITIDPQVTPTFAAVGPYCEGDVIPALTTTSNEGITGTWAPAIDNTTTTVYTFTPDAGQCATTQTLTITIDPQVTPTFAAVGPYCEGDAIPALPLSSNEGITGTWAPAIDNTTTTLYTFTPDAGQCATTNTMTITINHITASVTALTDQNCATPGSATVEGADGMAPYTYLWPVGAGGVVDGTASSLMAGNYNVTVQDLNGCSIVQPVSITDIGGFTANATVNANVLCYGQNQGEIELDILGGTADYDIDWGSGTATESTTNYIITGLTANNYDITITDVNSCQAVVNTTITEPTELLLSETLTSHVDVDCFGNSTGQLEVAAADGTPGYLYSLDGGAQQASGLFTGLTAGTYLLEVEDNNGCTESINITINEPADLTISEVMASHVDVDCFGNSTGQLEVAAADGTPGYLYSLDGGAQQASGLFTGLAAGTYLLEVEDNNSCTESINITINEPADLTISEVIASHVDVDCFGNSTGQLEVAAADGTPGYLYSLDGGAQQASGLFTGLAAGTYLLEVEDNNSCTESINITINEPADLTISEVIASHVDVDCFGNSTGQLEVAAADGTPGYLYSLDGGAQQASGLFTGLAAGTYLLEVEDNNSCTESINITINEPVDLTLSEVMASHVDVDCFGNSTGQLEVAAADGTPGYLYSLDGGAQQASGLFTGLTAGTYLLEVEDNNGCTESINITINEPADLTLSEVMASHVDIDCFGYSTGQLEVAATDGTPGYLYSLDGGAQQASGLFTGLVAGTYLLEVEDNNNCTESINITITEPTQLTASITAHTDQICATPGSATVEGANGTAPYTYSWPAGAGGVVDGTASALTIGNYEVTVYDLNLCSVTQIVNIIDIGGLNASATTVTNPLCYGSNEGSIDVTVLTGTADYTINWGTGSDITSTGAYTITGLVDGFYEITITDANSCQAIVNSTVTEPTELLISEVLASHVDVDCFGNSTGQLEVAAADGTPGYLYSLDGGAQQASGLFTGLAAGTYLLEVEDNNGCIESTNITINEPADLTISEVMASHVDVDCFGNSTGQLEVAAADGTPGYLYSLDGGAQQASGLFTGLAAGTYLLEVEDNNSCTESINITINEPADLTISEVMASHVNVDCFGNSTGQLEVAAADGTPGYLYSLDGGAQQASGLFTNLAEGTYLLEVEDNNGCTESINITITEPTQLTSSITAHADQICATPGSATVEGANGTAPYTYAWPAGAGGVVNGTASALTVGNYEVTVYDLNLCEVTQIVNIIDIGGLNASATTVADPLCYGGNEGSIDISILTGTADYTINWGTGSDVSSTGAYTITGLVDGFYEITITDANSCQAIVSATITEPADLTISEVLASHVNVDCFGNSTGQLEVAAADGTPNYMYSLDGGVQQASGLFTGLAEGTYILEVEDDNGCTETTSITITEPVDLTISEVLASHVDVDCFGNSTGELEVAAAGGTPGYLYSLNGGPQQTSGLFTGLSANSYTIEVEDNNGCTQSINITITSPSQLVLSEIMLSHVNIDCFGNINGELEVFASNGTPNYQYSLEGGSQQASGLFTNLAASIYNIEVEDANGCTENINIEILEPSELLVELSSVPANCGLSGGSATATIIGGTPDYSIIWSDPQSGNPIINLDPGNYSVTVTDANSCTSSASIEIGIAGAIHAAVNVVQPISCYGETDGILQSISNNGQTPLNHIWNPTGTGQTQNNLAAGTYTVTITDAWGCTGTASGSLVEPAPMIINATTNNISCNGYDDGSIFVTVSQGTPDYTFNWNGTDSENVLTDLSAGIYNLIVTDNNGCSMTESFTISQPDPLLLNNQVKHVSCYGFNDGAILMSANGGSGSYSYSIYDGNVYGSGSSHNSLSSGNYTLIATDNNNCEVRTDVLIIEPSEISASYVAYNPSCIGNNDGYIEINVVGGTQPYLFGWNQNYLDFPLISGLTDGNYDVIVTDSNNCVYNFGEIILTDNPVDCIKIPNAFTPNGDGPNDTWIIENIELFAGAYIYVYNRWGQELWVGRPGDEWDGQFNGKFVPAGTYLYIINLYDGSDPYTGTVTVVY